MKADFTVFFLVVFFLAAFIGWDWPDIAKIMPVYVAALPGLLLVIVQLYRDSTGWEHKPGSATSAIDMDLGEVQIDKVTERKRTLLFFGWFIGGAIGIWLLGLVIALPALVFLYILIEGREPWYKGLIGGALTYALVWGLFEYTLETRWPPGLLIDR